MSVHLYALILHLHPTEPATLPAMLGEEAHGAFLEVMRESNPALSAWLHEDVGAVKPFGVSLLVPWRALRRRSWHVRPEDTLRLRVTLVGQPLYQQFMEQFLAGQYTLRLGRATFQTGRIITSGVGESLAGHTTMEQIWEEARPQEGQRVRFVMPTTWRQGGTRRHFALLPEPRPLLQKLSKIWSGWAPPSLRYDYRPLLGALDQDGVILAAHHVRSVHWQATKPPTQGFIGWAAYNAHGTLEFRRLVDLLCRFSFYSGVGYGSGRGLGVVVPESLDREEVEEVRWPSTQYRSPC